MKFPIQRIALMTVVGMLVIVLGSACTLSGSSAAPVITPMPVASPTPIPSPTTAITLPTPTIAPTLDVFGTQTATAQGTFSAPSGLAVTTNPALSVTLTPGGIAITPLAPVTTGGTPTPLPNTMIQTSTPAAAAGGGSATASCPPTHTVQSGETLFRISLKYGLSVAALAQANGISNVDFLTIGQVLKVPCGATASGSAAAGSTPAPAAQTGVLKPQGDDTVDAATGDILHKVKAGENLFRIALAYGLDYHDVAKYNGITNVDSLEIGQIIRIKTK